MTLSSISTACDAMLAPNQPIGVSDAFGEIDICAAHGTPSGEDLGAMRGALSGQPQDPELHLSGSISVHGVCATELSRESAGHRSLLALADREALPHGYPRSGLAQYAGQCERHPRPLTAPASSWWTAGARFAASTLTAKTPSCPTCCTMCDNWSRNPHDDDHDAHPAHHQRSAERHRRRAPGLGLNAVLTTVKHD